MERKLLLFCAAVLLFLIILLPKYSVDRLQSKEILDQLRQLTENTDEISKIELKTTDGLYLTVEYSLTQPLEPSQRDDLFIKTQNYILSDEVKSVLTQELNAPNPRLFAEGFSIRFYYYSPNDQNTYWIYSLTDREELEGPRWDLIGPRDDGSHGVIATWYPETDEPLPDSATKRPHKASIETNPDAAGKSLAP